MAQRGVVGLRLIGAFKLVKGLLLAAIGVGALRLLHRDVETTLASWVAHLHVNQDLRLVQWGLSHVPALDSRRLAAISAATFFYAALLLTEGTGLLLRKRWAEYLTVIVTASFIPLELFELAKHVSFTRFIVTGINVAIVWYLIMTLASRKREREPRPTPGDSP